MAGKVKGKQIDLGKNEEKEQWREGEMRGLVRGTGKHREWSRRGKKWEGKWQEGKGEAYGFGEEGKGGKGKWREKKVEGRGREKGKWGRKGRGNGKRR